MSSLKLIVIEDDEGDLQACEDSAERYIHQKGRKLTLIKCPNIEEAFSHLDGSLDGAIIDLRLGRDQAAGSDIIRKIESLYLRIPIVILTGTPDEYSLNFPHLGLFKKGEVEHSEIFDILWDFQATGITRIMGGRGVIEKTLQDVFLKNILPHKSPWIGYARTAPIETERAMLRHVINHLLQLLDDDDDKFYPEEFLISPPLKTGVRTGSVAKKIGTEQFFVVLSPACDLIIRQNGRMKTEHLLLAEIDSLHDIIRPKLEGITSIEKKHKALTGIFSSHLSGNYHWIPETSATHGGFLNFRKLMSVPIERFPEIFETPSAQISPHFVKDITARFSSYYARQGQPEINCDDIAKKYAEN